MTRRSDERSPIAVAYHWASRIIAVCLAMVVPGLLGLWLDQKIGSKVLFMIVGFVLGITAGVWYLVRITSAENGDRDLSDGGNCER